MKNLDEIKFDEKKRQQAGMTVPEGFFEQFQQQIEAKIDQLESEKQAPVIEMPVRRHQSLMARWAVAACAVVLVGVGAFYMTTNEEVQEDVQVAQTESVDEQSELEEMMMHSVSDYDLYEYYCEL